MYNPFSIFLFIITIISLISGAVWMIVVRS